MPKSAPSSSSAPPNWAWPRTSPSTAARRSGTGFVKPFVWAGEGYQGQYPLLVSDRYLIVEAALKRCDELGTKAIAHGCTGMGNDQVRFDLAVKALGDYEIVAPIREIQKEHTEVRAYEQKYLEERGFGVRAKQKAYTINENLLGLTMSGGEIDRWEAPGEGARGWCAPRARMADAAAARDARASRTAKRSRSMARRSPATRCWPSSTACSRSTASAAASTPATPRSASRAASSSKRRA